MVKLNTMPKEIACELLTFIAEKEEFTSVCEALGGDITGTEVKALMRELAANLQKELVVEKGASYDVKNCSYLSKNAKKIISYLSPSEEKTLLRVFGLVEEK